MPEGVRPSSARVREALFSMIGASLEGQTVLDAFGGSGLLGLEAWSRGARVTCVDRDRRAVRVLAENAAALGADITVRAGDVLRLVPAMAPFDVVLADPPYALDPTPIAAALAPVVGRVLVVETDASATVTPPRQLALERHRVYGGTALWLFRPAPEIP